MQPDTRNLLYTVLLILLLAGCAPRVVEKPAPEVPEIDPREAQALSLAEDGDYLTAAELLQQLALEKPSPEQERLLLAAAENYFLAGDLDSANLLLNRLDVEALPDLALQRRLLLAEMTLSRNRPEQALALLQVAPREDAPLVLRQRYHKDLAEAYRLTGNLLESGRQLGELDLLVLDPAARLENQLDIIRTYAVLTDLALQSLQPEPPGTQGGWMELTRIIKQYGGDPQQAQPAMAEWRLRFPDHPALPELLDGYFQRLESQYLRPERLAILLPKEGRFANAAAALRNGLLAAYYEQEASLRPRLTFYDSSNPADIWPLYQQAVASGADMVIGPLDKQAVAQFARAGELDIPVLALNQVAPEVAPPSDLYQFGLSPEDEAGQVAEKAWVDGFSTAVVLTPEGNWGERVFTAFRDRWEQLGGVLAEHQRYNPKEHDFSLPIKALLNVDDSNARHKQLQRLLGKRLEFEPRRRQDADFVFLAATTQKARGIRPQLQFHHAADLPVYSTSHAYSGQPSPKEDEDLEGLRFPEIPWLLMEEPDSALSQQRLAAILPESASRYQRLYAMGIDSYRLLPHLARLQSSPREVLEGKTGNLHLDGKNHVRRQLVWAQIEQGLPRVIGYAPRMDDPQEAVNLVPLEQAIPETRPPVGILPAEQQTAPQTEDSDQPL